MTHCYIGGGCKSVDWPGLLDLGARLNTPVYRGVNGPRGPERILQRIHIVEDLLDATPHTPNAPTRATPTGAPHQGQAR